MNRIIGQLVQFNSIARKVAVLFVALSLMSASHWKAPAKDISFVYDSLNRLVEVHYPDKIIFYTYDDAGNRIGKTVQIIASAPQITQLSPRGAVAGTGPLTIKILGSNFTPNSYVEFNGETRPAQFVDQTELRIDLGPFDLVTAGRSSVVVFNPTPNLTFSSAKEFTVVNQAAIAGQVTAGGTGLPGVSLSLSGPESDTFTTDSNGFYSVAVLQNGSYTITPTLQHYSFDPTSRQIDYSGVSQNSLDFTASLVSYTIGGTIQNQSGQGIQGATVSLSGSAADSTTTDGAGNYSFSATALGDYTVTPSLQDYTFQPPSAQFNSLDADQTGDFTGIQLVQNRAPVDFDGDGKTDIGIFRPNPSSPLSHASPEGGPSQWWYLRSSDQGVGAFGFGDPTDLPVPYDFTGDGKADVAFFRPSTGEWYVLRSEDLSFYAFPFGAAGDIPAPGDFDADGVTDPAVYRPSTGQWFILRSSDQGVTAVPFGIAEDKPVVADYDGDGTDDIAVFRPSVREWWILKSGGGVSAFQFGEPGDLPAPGDYTGDGKADVAFFRPSGGEWYVLRSEDSSFYAFPWGQPGDIPAPGDYDGDGIYDAAVWRETQNGTWFINASTAGFLTAPFGQAGDVPLPYLTGVPQ